MHNSALRFDCFAISDKGMKRQNNEDALICNSDDGLFLVADGMGGENCGEVASSITADNFYRIISPYLSDQEVTVPFELSPEESIFKQALNHAVEIANSAVIEFAENNLSCRGMGSTLTAVVFNDWTLYIVHIGDSRLYKMDDKGLYQVTEDHTRVQEMVNEGLITPRQAKTHPKKNVLTRCIGRKARLRPDIFSIDWKPGNTFLICSDGLTDMVGDEEIFRELTESDSLESYAKRLIEMANEKGGKDNITLIVFRPLIE